MKLLLIKIGKAFHTLKREGLLRGGRRVFSAFFALFRQVGSGDVLFITGGVGDSARYRCQHVAEELASQGLRCSSTVQDNPFLVSYADKFSVFVFHRVLYTPSIARLIARIKKQRKEIIFETDDLVYDPEFLQHMDYFTQMNALERKLYENGVGGEILADPYVKVCTTSTTFLAGKLREKGKRVFVVRNKVSQQDVRMAEEILRDTKKDESMVRVAYLSGTPSHNKDFATIVPALTELFERYPSWRLVLVGPLDTSDQLRKFSDRIEHVPFLPRKQYFERVAQMDITLAPLEIGNPFCEAKSELKWFEAGLVGVPTVAAATGTFRAAITDGVDGYVAATTEEWIEKIGKLISDAEFRKRMGEKAREKVLARYTTADADDAEYYNRLREKIV
ncbi:MAG: glycosyltransferase [Candidatus Moraniibacteriota bacterium]